MNFNEAQEICREAGQNLVSIESAEEQQRIVSYLASNGFGGNYYWTSGNDQSTENSFVWLSTGRKMYYTNFASPSGQSEGNDCVQMNGDSAWQYKWMVSNCQIENVFICEVTK